MKIAGIDYSLTSPAICVYEYDVEEEKKEFFSFRECKSYCLTNNKRQLASNIPNIIIEPYPALFYGSFKSGAICIDMYWFI